MHIRVTGLFSLSSPGENPSGGCVPGTSDMVLIKKCENTSSKTDEKTCSKMQKQIQV